MPVPGPRIQSGPLPGYRNPEDELPDKFNLWDRPGPVTMAGRTPATMFVNLRGNLLGAGTIRRMWRQAVNMTPAQAAYSWTNSAPAPGRPVVSSGPLDITRALRYMTRSVYVGAGVDNSRYSALHTRIRPRVNHKPVTLPAGNVRTRPTTRNRMTSFGSRIPPLNGKADGAQRGLG